jgi:hypothetical protein
MTPNCAASMEYGGKNGTLISFPYEDCSNPTDCGKGFVFTVHHEGQIQDIVNAQISNNQDFLDNVLIRFNWHQKYGTPWHLASLDCDASPANFDLWRNSIDFNEVIDYCGVSVFAYGPAGLPDEDNPDIVILKMATKPFYKEHHLGWSTQYLFDMDIYDESTDHNDFKIIGRRANSTTKIFNNYYLSFIDYNPYSNYAFIDAWVAGTPWGDILPDNMIGYSGSQLTISDYNNSNQRMTIAMTRKEKKETDWRHLYSRSYYNIFNLYNNITFFESCYTGYNNIMNYMTTEFNTLLIPHSYQYMDDGVQQSASCKYMPSSSNKQYCPSTQGYNPSTQIYEPCNINLTEFLESTYNESTKQLCVSISQLPAFVFPNSTMPVGYRIYHNFGDQKTIEFDSYIDNTPIGPMYFCIDKCDMLNLLSLGKNKIHIGIDFYDSEGRILNNPGCDDLEFDLNIPVEFCDLLDVNVVKTNTTPTCCDYLVTLKFNGCEDNPDLMNIFSSMMFKSFKETSAINLTLMSNYNANMETGTASFTYQVCNADVSDNSSFEFYYFVNGNILKCTTGKLDFSSCNCNCPSSSILQSWLSVIPTPTPVGSECGENKCSVEAKLNIPGFYNCYNFYKVKKENEDPANKPIAGIPEDGNIFTGSYANLKCINKGEYVNYTIYLYKTLMDPNPCIITNSAFCPLEAEYEECDPSPCTNNDAKWSKPPLTKEYTLPSCPACKYEVTFRHRKNTCLNKQDIQILELRAKTDACTTSCGITADILQKEAMKKIIFENPMEFNPITGNELGDCNTTWRAILASCWAEYYLPLQLAQTAEGGYVKIFRPCVGAGCCTVEITVCRFAGPPPYISLSTQNNQPVENICSTLTKTVVDAASFGMNHYLPDGSVSYYHTIEVPCLNRCSVLFDLNVPKYYGKVSIHETDNNNYRITDDIEISNIFKDDILHSSVICNSECSELNLSIFSLQGELLMSNDFSIKKGVNEFILNLSRLSTGMYLIRYSPDGVYRNTEKLIIVK